MPPVIPFIAGAVTTAMGLSITTAVIVGAVAGAAVAAFTGGNILMGALMGGLGGAGGFALANAAGFGAAAATPATTGAAGAATDAAAAGSSVMADAGGTAAGAASNAATAALPSTAATGTQLLEAPGFAAELPVGGPSGLGDIVGSYGGGGLLDNPGAVTGIFDKAPTELVNLANTSGVAGEATKSGSGLLEGWNNVQSWIEENPELANGAVQSIGTGLESMNERDMAEQELIYKQELDDERRRNASFSKVPTTVWK